MEVTKFQPLIYWVFCYETSSASQVLVLRSVDCPNTNKILMWIVAHSCQFHWQFDMSNEIHHYSCLQTKVNKKLLNTQQVWSLTKTFDQRAVNFSDDLLLSKHDYTENAIVYNGAYFLVTLFTFAGLVRNLATFQINTKNILLFRMQPLSQKAVCIIMTLNKKCMILLVMKVGHSKRCLER